MESKVVGYCAVAAILGIIAAATGFAAEATKVKASEVYIAFDTCVYPSSPALALGIVSAVFTIITRIYISVSFGGSGCCRTDPNSTPISKLLFVFSWVASVVGVALLLTAVGLNNRRQVNTYYYIYCYVVKPGIFAAGAILALLSAVFGIGAYVTLTHTPPQNATNPVAYPMGAVNNVDPEKNPVPFPPQQQYPPQQHPPQQYPPQQYPPQQH